MVFADKLSILTLLKLNKKVWYIRNRPQEMVKPVQLAYGEGDFSEITESNDTKRRALERKRWVDTKALIVAANGAAYVATAITKSAAHGWGIKTQPLSDTDAAKTFNMSAIDDDTEVQQIIYNLLNGTAISGEGKEITVTEAKQASAPRRGVTIAYSSKADGSQISTVETPVSLQLFMQRYPPLKLNEDGSPPSQTFDFGDYPRLLDILRVGGAWAGDSLATDMPSESAAALMLAMRERQGSANQPRSSGATALSAIAAELETLYSSDSKDLEEIMPEFVQPI